MKWSNSNPDERYLRWIFFAFLFLRLSTNAVSGIKTDSALYYYDLLSSRTAWNQRASSFAFFERNFEDITALIFFEAEEGRKDNDQLRITRAAFAQATLLELLGNGNEALNAYDSALALIQNSGEKNLAFEILQRQSVLYIRRGRFDAALECLMSAHDTAVNLKDSAELRQIFLELALLHAELNDLNTANEYFMKCGVQARMFLCTPDEVRLQLNWLLFRTKVQETNSILEGLEALSTQCSVSDIPELYLIHQYVSAVTHAQLGQFRQARSEFLRCVEVAEITKNHYYIALSLLSLADLESERGNIAGALRVLGRCEKNASQNQFTKILLSVYRKKADIFGQLFEYSKQAELQSLYIEHQNILHPEQLLFKISLLRGELESSEDALLIETQKQTLALQEEMLSYRKLVTWGICAIVLLLLVATYILSVVNRRKKFLKVCLDNAFKSKSKEFQENDRELRQVRSLAVVEASNLRKEIKSKVSTLEGLDYLIKRDCANPVGSMLESDLQTSLSQLKKQLEKISNFLINRQKEGLDKRKRGNS